MSWKDALLEAIGHAQGQTALATKLSAVMRNPVSQQQVSKWLHKGKSFEPQYCLPIQYVTGGTVKASRFRPDVFPARTFDDMPLHLLVEQIESSESPEARAI